jgi:hypothetical protein
MIFRRLKMPVTRKTLDSRQVVKLAQLYDFPDYVKEASLAELQEPSQPSNPRHFADKRLPYDYPVHSKAATYFSLVRFAEEKAQHSAKVQPLIERVLHKAAEFWGIPNAVHKINTKHAQLNQSDDAPDSCFALVTASNGEKQRSYPLRNSLEVKRAAEWFQARRHQLREVHHCDERMEIASRILEKASQYGVGLTDDETTALERAAGYGSGDKRKIASMLRDRVKAAHRVSPETRVMMEKLAETVESQSDLFLDPGTRSKLAETVEDFDQAHGLLNRYTDLLPAPEDVLFETTRTKEASRGVEECALLSGSVYSMEDLARADKNAMRDIFGRDIVEDLMSGLQLDPEKMADFTQTLPLPDAEAMDRIMAESGVRPLRKEAAELGLSFEDWQLIKNSR